MWNRGDPPDSLIMNAFFNLFPLSIPKLSKATAPSPSIEYCEIPNPEMSRHVNIPCWQHALMNRISIVSGHIRVGWVTMEHFRWGGAHAWGERTCTPPSLFFLWRLQTIFVTDVPNFMRLNFSWFPGLKGQPINCHLHLQFWIRLFESPLKFCPRSVFFLHFFPAFSFFPRLFLDFSPDLFSRLFPRLFSRLLVKVMAQITWLLDFFYPSSGWGGFYFFQQSVTGVSILNILKVK